MIIWRRAGLRSAAAGILALLLTPAPASAEQILPYTIRPGDTLFELSRAYFPARGSMAQVQRRNHITNPRKLRVGGILKVPRRLLVDVKTLAKVESFSGDVLLELPGAGMPVRSGASLGEGAAIRTGRDGFVSLRLADESVVTIPSQSMVRIVRLRRVVMTGTVEREFAAEAGRVRARVTPMEDPASTFRVRTPLTVSAVRGTAFRIGYDATRALANTAVEEGKVEFSGTSAAVPGAAAGTLINPGFGATAGAGGAGAAIALLIAPRLIDPDKVQTEDDLHFALEPVAGATGYRLQVARDAGLLDLVSEDSGAVSVFTLPALPAGTYFARVTALDANGLEGLPRTYTFDRVRNAVGGAMGASGTGFERRYQFKWSGAADGTPQFRFQLARKDDPAHPVVDEPLGSGTEIAVTSLPAAEYAWRVLSIVAHGGKIVRVWSAEQAFEVTGGK